MLTEKQRWKLEVARNTVTHITMVLEDTFVDVFKLIEATDTRHTGFDAIKKMQSARDELMNFINALDYGVENKKGEETNMHDSANLQMAHKLAEESTATYLAREIKRVTGPMSVVGGPGLPSREGRPGAKVVGDDSELLAKTEHVRSKNEPLMSFYARIGLGPSQIRTMSKAEISRFCETVSANEDIKAPTGTFGRPPRQKFLLEA